MAQEKLTQAIIENSQSKKWDLARLEWDVVNFQDSEHPQECTCGHFPIREICTIQNRLTGKDLDVGNHCVKKFMGINSDKLFTSYKKVSKNSSASFNPEVINLAHRAHLINDWENTFYIDIWRKKSLTPKQEEKKEQVNAKILLAVRTGRWASAVKPVQSVS